MDAAAALEDYLRQVDIDRARLASSKNTDSRLRRAAKHAVPPRLRGTARLLVTRGMRRGQHRRATTLAAVRSPLLLHLGSGGRRKEGWVNIDLAGDPVDLALDLSEGLPFPDNSVDGIFHEHLLEHLYLEAGIALTRECFRALRRGGLLRIGVPDVATMIRQYAAGDPRLVNRAPARPTAMLALQEMFYWHRHVTMYDAETLDLLVRAAGFESTIPREFAETALPICPDSEGRRAGTLYVEARKP